MRIQAVLCSLSTSTSVSNSLVILFSDTILKRTSITSSLLDVLPSVNFSTNRKENLQHAPPSGESPTVDQPATTRSPPKGTTTLNIVPTKVIIAPHLAHSQSQMNWLIATFMDTITKAPQLDVWTSYVIITSHNTLKTRNPTISVARLMTWYMRYHEAHLETNPVTVIIALAASPLDAVNDLAWTGA